MIIFSCQNLESQFVLFHGVFSFHFADFMSLPKNPLFSLTLYIKNTLFLRVIKNKSGQVGRNPKKCCAATVFRRPLFKNKWAESGQMAKFCPYKPLQRLQNSTKCPPITHQNYKAHFRPYKSGQRFDQTVR